MKSTTRALAMTAAIIGGVATPALMASPALANGHHGHGHGHDRHGHGHGRVDFRDFDLSCHANERYWDWRLSGSRYWANRVEWVTLYPGTCCDPAARHGIGVPAGYLPGYQAPGTNTPGYQAPGAQTLGNQAPGGTTPGSNLGGGYGYGNGAGPGHDLPTTGGPYGSGGQDGGDNEDGDNPDGAIPGGGGDDGGNPPWVGDVPQVQTAAPEAGPRVLPVSGAPVDNAEAGLGDAPLLTDPSSAAALPLTGPATTPLVAVGAVLVAAGAVMARAGRHRRPVNRGRHALV